MKKKLKLKIIIKKKKIFDLNLDEKSDTFLKDYQYEGNYEHGGEG